MNGKMIINNSNQRPENSHIAKYESVIIDAIHSRAFSFKNDMSNFRRKNKRYFCECNCGNYANLGKRFINGHQAKGKKFPEQSKRMKKNNPMKNPLIAKKISKWQLALGDSHPSKRPEVRKKQSEAKKGKYSGKNSPLYGKKRPALSKKYIEEDNPNWKGGQIVVFCAQCKKPKYIYSTYQQNNYFCNYICSGKWASKRMLNGGAAHANSFIKNPSKPQVKLYKLIKSLYPQAILNHPSLSFSIDIAIPNLMIAIEYDGSYWHDVEKDKIRQNKLENIGWKFLRYQDYIPLIDELEKDLKGVKK